MNVNHLKKAAKNILFRLGYRKQAIHKYDYFFWPEELIFLARSAEISAKNNDGAMLEVGCAMGATTVFINKHLQWSELYNSGRKNVQYVCLDTFGGFMRGHVAHEQNGRGKSKESYDDYQVNSINWFRYMLGKNEIPNVILHKADAAEFDYGKIGPVAFCLLDVDLYIPTKAALSKIYPMLQNGGVIIVDDCQPDQRYDGARQAYVEFTEEMGMPQKIEHRKFGLITKVNG